jgi:predicted HicB family RNase H-like nuclease
MRDPMTAQGVTLQYCGYDGSIEPDERGYHGRLLYITDVVTYAGDTLYGLKQAFAAAVDDYLERCEMLGDKPCTPTTPRVSP